MIETKGSLHWRLVECRDCDLLDTYGWDEQGYGDIGREHARETGHHVVMWAEYRVDLNKPER